MAHKQGLLVGLLDQLGYTPESIVQNASFRQRLKVQKAVFLLRHLKVSPFTEYHFRIYL
jgi:uncharacterized protein YwgA